ncbi:MAG: hypothetical protein MJ252_07030 [archaeon]|nr:hypothetical protein [archaeon]
MPKLSKSQQKTETPLKKKKEIQDEFVEKRVEPQMIIDLCTNFENTFYVEENKLTEQDMKDFCKSSLYSEDEEGNLILEYSKFVAFVFKLSGIQINTENDDEVKKFSNLDEDTCTDEETIENLIEKCQQRKRFKMGLLSKIVNFVSENIYLTFDLSSQKEKERFQVFLVNTIKLASNGYQILRHISVMLLCGILKNIFSEIETTENITNAQDDKENKSMDEEQDDTATAKMNSKTIELLKNKLINLKSMSNIIIDKCLLERYSDTVSQIRTVISETMKDICASHFNFVFDNKKVLQHIPNCLYDTYGPVRNNFLRLIHDQLQTLPDEEDDNEETKKKKDILIKILSLHRDIILKICVDPDAYSSHCDSSKYAILIIRFLSKEKVLEDDTIRSLLPYLFSTEPRIRGLITNIAMKHILNFEGEEEEEKKKKKEKKKENPKKKEKKSEDAMDIDQPSEPEAAEPSDESVSPEVLEKEKMKRINNADVLLSFAKDLCQDDIVMVRVLVDNFWTRLNLIKNPEAFFDFIEKYQEDKNKSQLIYLSLLFIKAIVENIQHCIEESKDDTFKAIYSKFSELLIGKSSLYLKKFIIEKNLQNTEYSTKICMSYLDLFSCFKYYTGTVSNINFQETLSLISEFKNIFFSSIVDFIPDEDPRIQKKNQDAANKLSAALLKSIKVILESNLLSSFRNEDQQEINEILFSFEKNDSLISLFYDKLKNELISSDFYKDVLSHDCNCDSQEGYLDNYQSILQHHILTNGSNVYMLLSKLLYVFDNFGNTIVEMNDGDGGLNYVELSQFFFNILRHNMLFMNGASVIRQFQINHVLGELYEKIHLLLFSNLLKNPNGVPGKDQYLMIRNKLIEAYMSTLDLKREEGETEYNAYLINFISNSLCNFLAMISYTTSEKLTDTDLIYQIPDEVINGMTVFLRENFIKYFIYVKRKIKEQISGDSGKNKGQPQSQSDAPGESQDPQSKAEEDIFDKGDKGEEENPNEEMKISQLEEQVLLKNFILISKKFSKVFFFNLGLIKNINFSCLYFETFFLLKYPKIVEDISHYTMQDILKKELNVYKYNKETKKEEESPENKENTSASKVFSDMNFTYDICPVIYYVTKTALKLFNNECLSYSDSNGDCLVSFEEKVEMVATFYYAYLNGLREIKKNFYFVELLRGDKIICKDLHFLKEFIITSMVFALDTKVENESQAGVKDIENVYFLKIIQKIINTGLNVFQQEDYKEFIFGFMSLIKDIELTEGINEEHLRIIEKFKKFLLNKAKLDITKEDEDELNIKTPVTKKGKRRRKKKKNKKEEDSSEVASEVASVTSETPIVANTMESYGNLDSEVPEKKPPKKTRRKKKTKKTRVKKEDKKEEPKEEPKEDKKDEPMEDKKEDVEMKSDVPQEEEIFPPKKKKKTKKTKAPKTVKKTVDEKVDEIEEEEKKKPKTRKKTRARKRKMPKKDEDDTSKNEDDASKNEGETTKNEGDASKNEGDEQPAPKPKKTRKRKKKH